MVRKNRTWTDMTWCRSSPSSPHRVWHQCSPNRTHPPLFARLFPYGAFDVYSTATLKTATLTPLLTHAHARVCEQRRSYCTRLYQTVASVRRVLFGRHLSFFLHRARVFLYWKMFCVLIFCSAAHTQKKSRKASGRFEVFICAYFCVERVDIAYLHLIAVRYGPTKSDRSYSRFHRNAVGFAGVTSDNWHNCSLGWSVASHPWSGSLGLKTLPQS